MKKHLLLSFVFCTLLQFVACGQKSNSSHKESAVIANDSILVAPLEYGKIVELPNGKRQYLNSKNELIKEVVGINQYNPLALIYGLTLRDNDSRVKYGSFDFKLLNSKNQDKILKNLDVKIPKAKIDKIYFSEGTGWSSIGLQGYHITFSSDDYDDYNADKTIIEYIDNQDSSIKYIETPRRLECIGISTSGQFIYGIYSNVSQEEGVASKDKGIIIYDLRDQTEWLRLDFDSLLSPNSIGSLEHIKLLDNDFLYLEICDTEPFVEKTIHDKKIFVDIKNKVLYESVNKGRFYGAYDVSIKDNNIYFDFQSEDDISENLILDYNKINFRK